MNIGILLPSVYTSRRFGEGRIFAPQSIGVALADGLVQKGHTVYFYASQDIITKAQLVVGDSTLTDRDLVYYQFRNRNDLEQKYTTTEIIKRDFENDLTFKAFQDGMDGRLDIIHSFHDFNSHYFNELTKFPTIYTLHDPLPQSIDTIEYQRLKKFSHHSYISISNSQRKSILSLSFIATIYHGLDLREYIYDPIGGDHLIHFGRIMKDKGTHTAIEVAQRMKIPIHIATSTIRANRSQDYYDQYIAPKIDNNQVQLIGFLDGKEKSKYIGSGKAFIFPLSWEEPFGLVMVEAMACGTPVIAYNRGSAAEIVRDGVTGFIIDSDNQDRPGKGSWVVKKQGLEGLLEAVQRINEISRVTCRKHVEENFTIQKMVDHHELVYQQLVASQDKGK